jgi:hypothetical protein
VTTRRMVSVAEFRELGYKLAELNRAELRAEAQRLGVRVNAGDSNPKIRRLIRRHLRHREAA